MAGRLISAFTQFFDGAGDPLSYGWLKFLESGSNNTLKATYNDSDLNIANANPLRLDGDGRCPSVFGEGRYRIILYQNDPNDETTPGAMIQSFDPVTAQEETTAGGGAGTFEVWSSITDYVVGDIVTHSSKYYRSIANFNLNKNPAVEDGYWEEFEFVVYWNENVDYDIGELVRDSENLYFSTIANNLNNSPSSHPVEWRRVDHVNLISDVYTTNYNVDVTDRDKVIILGSSAILSCTFTLPTALSTYDGFIYNFYNASDYDLIIASSVPQTLWLSNQIILKKGSYLPLQYNYEYDKWLPIGGNCGPALGGQDIGTLANPVLTIYLNALNMVGNLDILLSGVELWRFDTSGTFYPLATNPSPDIGSLTYPIADLWQNGTHYFNNADNFIYGAATELTVSGKSILTFEIVDTPTYFAGLNSSGFYIQAPTTFTGSMTLIGNAIIAGNVYPNSDSAYNLGIYQTNEWANIYIGTGRVWFRDGTANIQHNGGSWYFANTTGHFYFDGPSGGDWYFREGSSIRFALNDTGVLQILGDGSTSTFNLSLGASSQGKIFNNSGGMYLYTSGYIYFYTSNSSRWQMDSSGHFKPMTANSFDIGGTTAEIRNLYLGSGLYFGTSQYFYMQEYDGQVTINNSTWTTLIPAGVNGLFFFTIDASGASAYSGAFGIFTLYDSPSGRQVSTADGLAGFGYTQFDGSGNFQVKSSLIITTAYVRVIRLKGPYA